MRASSGRRRVALVVACAVTAACAGRVVETRRSTQGPFEIETLVTRISSGGFPNTSGNPFATTPATYFRIRHGGRPVPVGDDADPRFWDAYFLSGAAAPAVLAATTDVLLVVDGPHGAEVRTLARSDGDMATLQWLDGGGAPGPQDAIGIHDGRAVSRTLAGGTLLLVSGRTVLDVRTLATHEVGWNDAATLRAAEGFYAAGSPVCALSPGRTQLVAVGSRSRDDDDEWALVAVDFVHGGAYAVPFDRDATRFEEPSDATVAWIDHYFRWTTGADGRERLELRRPVVPLPWIGRVRRTSPATAEYDLVPVKAAMLPAFADFLARDLGAAVTPRADDPHTLRADVDGVPLTVWYRPEARAVAVFVDATSGPPRSDAAAVVERVAARFDDELRAGRHQALFDSFAGTAR